MRTGVPATAVQKGYVGNFTGELFAKQGHLGAMLALVGIQGGPGGRGTVPALFMLRKAFFEQDMGYACAVGLVLTAVAVAAVTLFVVSEELVARRAQSPIVVNVDAVADADDEGEEKEAKKSEEEEKEAAAKAAAATFGLFSEK